MIKPDNWFKSTLVDDTIHHIRWVTDAFCLPVTVAFSGGKDSIVLLDLVRRSGIMHKAIFNLTTVDPPEIVYFIRKNYPDVIIGRPQYSMWQLIVKQRVPPDRIRRFCCKYLKERSRPGLTFTGIREEESSNRKHRSKLEIRGSKEVMFHPLMKWNEADIWRWIEDNNLEYPATYDQEFKRIGCIGCPMGSIKQREYQFKIWPKYRQAYIGAFDRCVKKRIKDGLKTTWTTGQEMFDWWMRK